MHELDHINGKTMTHWRLSEGNIDIINGEEDNYKHMKAVRIFHFFLNLL